MSKILKNVSSLISGQFLVLIINFVSITFAARFLGVDNFGKFAALLALVTIISKFYDFGFAPIVFRELSQKNNKFYLLNTSILVSFSLFLIVVTITNIILIILDSSVNEMVLFNVMLFNTLFSVKFISLRELLTVPFKVDHMMQLPMLVSVFDNLLLLVLIIIMPYVNGDYSYFIFIYFISNVPGLFLIFFLLKKKYNFQLSFNFKSYLWLIKESIPIYGFIILDIFYQQIDILLLGGFYSNFEVGVYSASMRLVFPLLIIPSSIVQTVFPIISKNIETGLEANKNLIKITYKLLLLFSIFSAFTFYFKSEEFILLTFGNEYLESHHTSRLLYISQIFFYFNYFTLNLFVAFKKQKWNFIYAIAILIINVALDLVLIPKLSYEGVGIAKVLTNLFGFLFLGYFYKKIFNNYYYFEIKPILLIGIFILFNFYSSNFNLVIYLILSTTIFPVLIYTLKVFAKSEVILFLKFFDKNEWAIKFINKYY